VLETLAGLMPTYATFGILLIPTGVASLMFTTSANASVQMGTSASMRGRVMGLYLLVFMGGAPFGSLLIGWLAQVTSPRVSIVGGGVVSFLAAAILGLVFARRKGLRVERTPGPVPHLRVLAPDSEPLERVAH